MKKKLSYIFYLGLCFVSCQHFSNSVTDQVSEPDKPVDRTYSREDILNILQAVRKYSPARKLWKAFSENKSDTLFFVRSVAFPDTLPKTFDFNKPMIWISLTGNDLYKTEIAYRLDLSIPRFQIAWNASSVRFHSNKLGIDQIFLLKFENGQWVVKISNSRRLY